MKVIKIKKVFTLWWRTYQCQTDPMIINEYDGFLRPTVALKLLNGEYLYIGAERIKEMKFLPDKKNERGSNADESSHPDGRGVGETGEK